MLFASRFPILQCFLLRGSLLCNAFRTCVMSCLRMYVPVYKHVLHIITSYVAGRPGGVAGCPLAYYTS